MNPRNTALETFQVNSPALPSRTGEFELVDALDDSRALATWLDSCRRFKSAHTVRSYEKEAIRFRMWLEWRKGDTPRLLAEARPPDINAYLDYLGEPTPFPAQLLRRYRKTSQPFAGTLKGSSIRQAIVILATMYDRFREIEDFNGQPYSAFNPFALVRGSVTNAARAAADEPMAMEQPKLLPVPIWAQVLKHLDQAVLANKDDPKAHRDRWVLKLLYNAWLRREEATAIKMSSFSNTTGKWRLYVVGKGRKADSIIATDELMDSLRAYREFHELPPYPLPGEDRPAVLPLRKKSVGTAHVSPQTIYRTVLDVFEAVATTIQDESPETAALLRQAGPHWMRHSGITHAADADLDVKYASKQARHADIRTTMKNYYHPDDEPMREQLERSGKKNKK